MERVHITYNPYCTHIICNSYKVRRVGKREGEKAYDIICPSVGIASCLQGKKKKKKKCVIDVVIQSASGPPNLGK